MMSGTDDGDVYVSEGEAPRRWWKVPVPHGPEYYARMARKWGLVSVAMAAVHVVLYVLGRAG
jgi:hypothetical protein